MGLTLNCYGGSDVKNFDVKIARVDLTRPCAKKQSAPTRQMTGERDAPMHQTLRRIGRETRRHFLQIVENIDLFKLSYDRGRRQSAMFRKM